MVRYRETWNVLNQDKTFIWYALGRYRISDVQILLSCNLVNNTNVNWAWCLEPNNTCIKPLFEVWEWFNIYVFSVLLLIKKFGNSRHHQFCSRKKETKCNAFVVKSVMWASLSHLVPPPLSRVHCCTPYCLLMREDHNH